MLRMSKAHLGRKKNGEKRPEDAHLAAHQSLLDRLLRLKQRERAQNAVAQNLATFTASRRLVSGLLRLH